MTAASIPILNGKLQAPRVFQVVERRRLVSALANIAQKKAALVVAGAGYGKTTLVVQTANELGLPTVWYRLDETDADIHVFLSYLIKGIRNYYPSFLPLFPDQFSPDKQRLLHRQVFWLNLIQALESQAREDLLLVLDDYHFVQENEDINAFLTFFLERLPDTVHVVLVGRFEPGLELARLRSTRELIDIREKDLKFGYRETEKLFREVFDCGFSDPHLKILQQKSEGWAAGLIMLYQSLRNSDPESVATALNAFHGFGDSLQSYFEENVFLKLPAGIRDFMVKTSILPRLDAEFCDAYLGIETSETTLSMLERNHLFTHRSTNVTPGYHYHQLLHDFLTGKFFQLYTPTERRLFYETAGDLSCQQGMDEEALRLYLEGDCEEKACRLFLKLDTRIFFITGVKLVSLFFEKIANDRVNGDPRLLFLKSKFLTLKGDTRGAVGCLENGLKQIRKNGPQEMAAWFQKELGFQLYYTGKIKDAVAQFREVLSASGDDHELGSEASGMLGFLLTLQGRLPEANDYIDQSIALSDRIPEEEKLPASAWIHINRSNSSHYAGDFVKSRMLAVEGRQVLANHNVVALLPLAYMQTALAEQALGDYEAGIAEVTKGIEIAEAHGINDSMLAWLYATKGMNYLGLGRFEDVLDLGRQSLELFRNIGNKWGMANVHDLLHKAHVLLGKLSEAEAHLEFGFEAIKGQDLPITFNTLKLGQAGLQIRKNRIDDALARLDSLHKPLISSKFFTCVIHLIQAGLYHRQNPGKECSAHFSQGYDIAVENRYPVRKIFELQPVISELTELESHYRSHCGEPNDRQEPLIFAKDATPAIPDRKPGSQGSLFVVCLGPFKVLKDGREIPLERWKSGKSRVLFQYLASKQGRGFIPKEVLMEVLWPNESPEKCTKRLNVAFTTLRNILEPDRSVGTPSKYILRYKDGYRLDLGDNGAVDIFEFLNRVHRAGELAETYPQNQAEVLGCYEEAESIFAGELLSSDPYSEWCLPERERLNRIYLEVLSKLLAIYETRPDPGKCKKAIDAYLKMDPYAEPVYRKLMRVYAGMGDRKMIIETYRRCRELFRRDLDLTLTDETEALYRELLQSDEA